MHDIREFQGEYRWLSNFWPAPVELDGVVYPCVENAYQAAKLAIEKRIEFPYASCAPGLAKRAGRGTQGEDWPRRKVGVMHFLLAQKFAFGTPLAERLLATGDAVLIEGNRWHDTFWGVCNGRGKNVLGRLLMARRDVLRGLVDPWPVVRTDAPVEPLSSLDLF